MKRWTTSRVLALGILGVDAAATALTLHFCALAIRLDYTGTMPYLTALIGAQQAATAIVLAAYFGKAKAENTRGGITYDAALGNGEFDA